MENSSKALLIAGGMLITILVLSLIIIVYNKVTEQMQIKDQSQYEEETIKFNQQYEAYNRDVTGFELVSLMNKIVDYNTLNTVSSIDNDYENNNTGKAFTEMYIQFKITDEKIKNLLYKRGIYDSQKKDAKKELEEIRKKIKEYENSYGTAVMSKLAALGSDYNKNTQEGLNRIKEVLGIKPNEQIDTGSLPSNSELEEYECYIEFKRANFKCTGTEYDKKTGRIIKMMFEQK